MLTHRLMYLAVAMSVVGCSMNSLPTENRLWFNYGDLSSRVADDDGNIRVLIRVAQDVSPESMAALRSVIRVEAGSLPVEFHVSDDFYSSTGPRLIVDIRSPRDEWLLLYVDELPPGIVEGPRTVDDRIGVRLRPGSHPSARSIVACTGSHRGKLDVHLVLTEPVAEYPENLVRVEADGSPCTGTRLARPGEAITFQCSNASLLSSLAVSVQGIPNLAGTNVFTTVDGQSLLEDEFLPSTAVVDDDCLFWRF